MSMVLHQEPAPAFALGAVEPNIARAIQVENVFGPERAGPLGETVAAYRQGFRARPAVAGELTLLEDGESRLSPAEEERAHAMLATLGLAPERRAAILDDLGWKVALVPRTARRVLDLGCGDATEAVLLRARLGPEAEITAVDYRRDFGPELERVADVRFESGDLIAYAAARPGAFDLV